MNKKLKARRGTHTHARLSFCTSSLIHLSFLTNKKSVKNAPRLEDLKNQRADIVRTSTFEETFTVDDKEEEVVMPDEVIDPLYDDDDDEATNGDNEDIYETVYEQELYCPSQA